MHLWYDDSNYVSITEKREGNNIDVTIDVVNHNKDTSR